MRLAGVRALLFSAVALVMAGAGAGCDNPFDPLKSSETIQGLAYVEFSAGMEHWDTDPEWDGIEIDMLYYNQFTEQLTFHDKPHKIEVEFWSQKDNPVPDTTVAKVQDRLLGTQTVELVNSDDKIRLYIESYGLFLPLPSTEDIVGCLLVRVFPPQAEPLVSYQCGQTFYTYEVPPL